MTTTPRERLVGTHRADQALRRLLAAVLAAPRPVPCTTGAGDWTHPTDVAQVAHAMRACAACACLTECAVFAELEQPRGGIVLAAQWWDRHGPHPDPPTRLT